MPEYRRSEQIREGLTQIAIMSKRKELHYVVRLLISYIGFYRKPPSFGGYPEGGRLILSTRFLYLLYLVYPIELA